MKSHFRLAFAFMFGALMFGAACNVATTQAEPQTPPRAANEAQGAEVANSASTSDERAKINGASVSGIYKRRTEKDGEGYDNTLTVEDKGAGKLHVTLEGAYVYKAGAGESMHEASGEGAARLSGSTAIAEIRDEAENICRVAIEFAAGEATVKIPDSCRFNVDLGGAYRKSSAKNESSPQRDAKSPAESATGARVSWAGLNDFLNDFEKHKPGDRFVISNIPTNATSRRTRADEFGNKTYKGLFYLDVEEIGAENGNTLLTSAALIKSLDENGEFEPVSLRAVAVLAQSNGKFDVYRVPFVVKIEGLDENGKVIWTATGSEPARVNFTH